MIPCEGGSMAAYVVTPATLPAPAVVMVPAVFGVNEDARSWADRYAQHGFICIVPDFFWRTLPGPLRPDVEDDVAKAIGRTRSFDVEQGVRDLTSARDYALALPACNGTWAVAGYCFGGRYTLRAGAYLGADAVVAFHPTKMAVELEAAAAVRCPASFHFGGADELAPPADVAAVRAAMAGNPRAEICDYPGVGHAFTMAGEHYDADAAERSFALAVRTLEPLKVQDRASVGTVRS